MKVLINLSTIKKGGGQNVALNFLYDLFNSSYNHDFVFLVVKNSEIHKFLLKENNAKILFTVGNPFLRIFYELFKFSWLLKKSKIDIIYTYFGYGLFINNIPQVCGVAASNIFYPEIKFWKGNFINVILKRLIDRYRIYGIKRAEALIFENKYMEERSHTLFHIDPGKTCYIPPSYNPDFGEEVLNCSVLREGGVKILMLCGWQRNKNILEVPEIAYYLRKYSHSQFKFIITAPLDGSGEYKIFKKLVEKYDVYDMISIIGPVAKSRLKSLYEQIDFVLLLSKLESFSNNIIESWLFGKPLIISNEKWAKSICGEAAYYVDRDNVREISSAIVKLQNSNDIISKLTYNGSEKLYKYPSITQRTKLEISFLEKFYRK
ncbi:MAG: glycosyltransferase [Bacteroidales bacterium]|jgi:glycosyltransferase involved in cell wall biosynthesis|nr:glycosyltransferase [Bacteroidales bacterium]